ncbi:InlB B-repeat-containing protein [Hominiventricola aquisgranensis]|uniref:Bacterial repeat domain-containing protein n=1 Tax=Hominiventricola aquisgranensis TaxID=3133164 RepID=A0ABV1I390_9FIRM
MRWYKRLGALLLAAVLILGLCQIPGGDVEAATAVTYRVKNVTFNKTTFTDSTGQYTMQLADTNPVMVDEKNDIIYIIYKSIPERPDGDTIQFICKNDVAIESDPSSTKVYQFTIAVNSKSIEGDPTKATVKVGTRRDITTTTFVLKSDTDRPTIGGDKFDGEYPQITSFDLLAGNEIAGISTNNATVDIVQKHLTAEELASNNILDAGSINITLAEAIGAFRQVRLGKTYYSVKSGCPDITYQTASVLTKDLLWDSRTHIVYLDLLATNKNNLEQTFRYKVNLNIAGYLYTLSDRSFLDIDGILGLTTNIESRVDNEVDGVMTIKTRKYLSGLSGLPVKPHYAAGAFMVADSITGGTLNKDGSITPENLNKGLSFRIQNAMGDQKPYSIQVVTPWALQWKGSDNSQIKNVLKDGVVQERTGAATYTVETLDAGSNVEVQLTAPKGKVLDKVVLKKGDGSTVDGVTYKNGSFSFVMPSDVVTIESISWKDGRYHNVSVSAEDTDGKELDSQYCTATIKVGDVEDTVAAMKDTVTLLPKTEQHPYYQYELDHWDYDASVLKDARRDETTHALTFTMPDQEVAVKAVYKKTGTQMTFQLKGANGGWFQGYMDNQGHTFYVRTEGQGYTDIFKPGAQIKLNLTSTNSTGYRFDGWKNAYGTAWEDNGTWKGGQPVIMIGSEPQTWVAEFKAKAFGSVTLQSADESQGTVTGTYKESTGITFETVYEGEEVALTATASEGYLFDHWDVVDEDNTTRDLLKDAGPTATLTRAEGDGKDLTVTAVFKVDPVYKSKECEITNVELLDKDGKVVRGMSNKDGRTLTIALTKTDMSAEDAEGLKMEGKYFLRITHSPKSTVYHSSFDDAHPTNPDLAWNKGNVTCPIEVNSLGEEFVVTAEDPTCQQTYTIKITYESEKPVISDMTVERASETEAKVTFTSDTKGNYSYLYKKANAEEPTQDEVLASALKGSIGAGSSQTINLKDLSNTAYKVYLVVKGNMNGAMPSDVVAIAVPKIGTYTVGNFCSESGGTVTVDKTRADAGEKITVTVTPKTGMKLDSLTYSTDLAGSAPVSILDKKVSEGVYVFDMPTANITIGCTWSKTSETDGPTITGFVINGTSGTISQSAGTIKITMPYGTDLTSLKPEITLQNAVSVSPASGTAVNLSGPVTYTVTAEDGTTKTYTVTATVAAQSTSDKLWEGMLDNVGGSTDHSGKNTWWEKAKDKKKHNNYPTYW